MPQKKIAILQSNYLPWKGVFDMIHQVDVFVFLEDVQYTTCDWRNRNRILTNSGPTWITVPVLRGSNQAQTIAEVAIDNSTPWQKKHLNAFQMNYGRAPYFKQYQWLLSELYEAQRWESLSALNIFATQTIAKELGIQTEFVNSLDLQTSGKKDDKLIEVCQKLGGDAYLSGPAAQDYIQPEKFAQHQIELSYIEYQYPEYPQLQRPFTHQVTILDLLFNCGPKTPDYIWGWRTASPKEHSQ